MSSAIPPVTVGMPVYNGERYLAAAIDSIVGQTYGDFQFIISDNASTDNTAEICRSYAARDKRIVYNRLQKNCGAAPNFNRVFLMGRSPFFKFAAADDLCAPRFLEVCMAAFKEAPSDTVLCFPTTIRIDENGTEQGIIEEKMDLRQQQPHARFRSFLQHYWLANCFYGVLRSNAYRSTRLHKSYDAADIVLLGELALRGQFWQLSDALFLRRFHSEMSHKANPTATKMRSWYDSSRRSSRSYPKNRMFWEFVRAIDTTDMSVAERMRCRRVFTTVWLSKYWRAMARESLEGIGIPVPRRRGLGRT